MNLTAKSAPALGQVTYVCEGRSTRTVMTKASSRPWFGYRTADMSHDQYQYMA